VVEPDNLSLDEVVLFFKMMVLNFSELFPYKFLVEKVSDFNFFPFFS
jgi:hypothetical protein